MSNSPMQWTQTTPTISRLDYIATAIYAAYIASGDAHTIQWTVSEAKGLIEQLDKEQQEGAKPKRIPTVAQLETEWVALREMQRQCSEAIAHRDDLLEAAKDVLALRDGGLSPILPKAFDVIGRLRDAIAKAEGGQP